MCMFASAGELVAREIRTIDCRLLNESERWLRDGCVSTRYAQRYPGTREAHLPRFRAARHVPYYPRIEFLEIEMRGIRNGHPVKCFFLSQELRESESRSPFLLQKKTGDIDASEVKSVVDAVVIGIGKIPIVPGFEISAEHQIQFEVQMGSRLVYAFAGVTHARNPFPAADPLAAADVNLTKVSVEAVIRGAIPEVLNHDIAPIIGIARHLIGVHHLSVRNRPDFVHWLAPRVAMKTFNIDAFVKSRVDYSFRSPDRIADEPVTPAFPWGRFHPLIVALDVLVKIRTTPAKKRVVIGRKADLDFGILSGHRDRKRDRAQGHRETPPHHRRFFSPICGQSFLISSMSEAASPDAM